MSVYQGLNPIGGLLVQNEIEQPNGKIVVITYTDDGTGKNAIKFTTFTDIHTRRNSAHKQIVLEKQQKFRRKSLTL